MFWGIDANFKRKEADERQRQLDVANGIPPKRPNLADFVDADFFRYQLMISNTIEKAEQADKA